MSPHRYRLQPYTTPSSRYTCPSCGAHRRFVRYIDAETGQHLAPYVGRCERIEQCMYHYPPRRFFAEHPDLVPSRDLVLPAAVRAAAVRAAAAPPEPPSYIDWQHFSDSLEDFRPNHFVQYLYSRYDRTEVDWRILRYNIGTSDHWPGATVFWQIDAQERLRTGKVMLYDRTTGRRVREPFNHVSWAHTVLGYEGFRLRQCLFGEHLMVTDRRSPIAITESEKSAMIASLHIPEYLWMATGGREMLTADRLQPLRGRDVILYPDAGSYELWCRRAQELRHIVPMRVSRLMEQHREHGSDIADYFLENRDERIGNRE